MKVRAVILLAALSVALPARSTTLREQYDFCVSNAYLSLLVEGRPQIALTAEAAVQGCETELQALYSLLINTNMQPKQALWVISSIRSIAKRRLLPR